MAATAEENRDQGPRQAKRLADPKIQSTYGGDPVAFAMHEYLFYKCHKCKQPYFAGNYACQAADDGKFDPAERIFDFVLSSYRRGRGRCFLFHELICPFHPCGYSNAAADLRGVPAFAGRSAAIQRNGNYPEIYKENTIGLLEQPAFLREMPQAHDGSMNEKQKMEAFKKLRADPRTCPLKRRHPPNGFEFGLGCTMCADKHIEADNKAAEEKAKAEKAQKKNNRRRR
eukprot:jgi/Bigna1/70782/fgenesh1_pg.13_\